MTNLLTKFFIKNSDDINNPIVRKNYGTLAGAVGICCNLLLFTIKILAGLLLVQFLLWLMLLITFLMPVLP